jgi:exopolysaccharide biosynthesis protein
VEYQALQATNVFAFGPILVSEGEINRRVLEADYYPYEEPRMAIGMIEPFHYIIVAVEGRKKASAGATPAWLARKMQELGCVEALNLDGGGTAVLIFMGKTINRTEKNLRSINSLITFGQADQYPDE